MPTIYRRGTVSSFNNLISVLAGAISDSGYYSLVRYYTESGKVNYVYALPHVNGNEYLRLEFHDTGSYYNIEFYTYYFYDSSGNNCGVSSLGSSQIVSDDLFVVIITSKVIFFALTGQSFCYIITPLKYPYNTVYTITQSVTSGNNKTIYLDSTAGIVPNSKWIISTESTAGRCLTKVTSVDSDYVVVDYVGMNVPAGSKFMKFRSSYVLFSTNGVYTISLPDYSTSSSSLSPCGEWSSALLIDSGIFPYYNNYFIDFITGFPLLLKVYGNYTSLLNFITLDDNAMYIVPEGMNLTIPTDNVIHYDIVSQGTVSSATSNTLTDSSKNWTTNSLVGKYVILQSTKDCKKITSNTSTTITVSPNFFSTPSNGSSYIICEKSFYISNLNNIVGQQIGYLTFPLFDL